MCLTNICVLFVLLNGFLSCNGQLIKPCSYKDIPCLSKSTETFLQASIAGIPAMNVLPIDPWQAKSVVVPSVNGLKIDLKNVKVTGMKELKIQNFNINPYNKSVVLAMEYNGQVEAEVTVTKDSSSASGKLVGVSKEVLTAKYTYDLKPNEKGEEYFSVGPEDIFCEIADEPVLTIDDPEAAKYIGQDDSSASGVSKLILCTVLQDAYRTVMSNLRASSKFFPKTGYFTDLP